MLPEDMAPGEDPEDPELDIIRNELDVRVYAGRVDTEPSDRAPDWVFE